MPLLASKQYFMHIIIYIRNALLLLLQICFGILCFTGKNQEWRKESKKKDAESENQEYWFTFPFYQYFEH